MHLILERIMNHNMAESIGAMTSLQVIGNDVSREVLDDSVDFLLSVDQQEQICHQFLVRFELHQPQKTAACDQVHVVIPKQVCVHLPSQVVSENFIGDSGQFIGQNLALAVFAAPLNVAKEQNA